MTEQPVPQGATTTLPPQSANGNSPQLPPAAPGRKSGRTHTRIRGMRTSLIAAAAGLIAAAAGLIVAAAGTARITQLRRIMRRDRREPPAS
jgi:hypothetical protein